MSTRPITPLPYELTRLARLVCLPLGDSRPTSESIDTAVANLAIHRHEVGALLHLATRMGAQVIEPAVVTMLTQSYQENVRRQDELWLLLRRIAAAFSEHGIEWVVVNGLPQATQLYPDPAWRVCGTDGVHILVTTATSDAAAHLLRKHGCALADFGNPSPRALARAGLRPEYQLSMVDRISQQRISLHATLAFADGSVGKIFERAAVYRPRKSLDENDIPSPNLGGALALQILLHGGHGRWSQLKWLVDLAELFKKLDTAGEAELIEAIEAADILPSMVASLLVYEAVFAAELRGNLGEWLRRQAVTAEIETRCKYHCEALMSPQLSIPRHRPAGPVKTVPWPVRALRRATHKAKHSLVLGRLRDRYRSFAAGHSRKPGHYQLNTATRANRYPLVFRFAQEQLAGMQAPRILSFGCSTGQEVFTLRSYFPHASLKGIDIDPGCIAACEVRLKHSDDSAIRFEIADSTDHEPAASYDAIFSMAVLRDASLDAADAQRNESAIRFDDFERTVRDFARCLKPGGLLFIAHSNFRFGDTEVAADFDVVLQAEPLRSGLSSALFDREDRRIHAVYRSVGFRKKIALL